MPASGVLSAQGGGMLLIPIYSMVEGIHLLTRTPAVLSHTTVGRLATCLAVALLIYPSAQTAIMA